MRDSVGLRVCGSQDWPFVEVHAFLSLEAINGTPRTSLQEDGQTLQAPDQLKLCNIANGSTTTLLFH